MNHNCNNRPETNQEFDMIAPIFKGCPANTAANSRTAVAPLPSTEPSELSLISVWLSTLAPIKAAGATSSWLHRTSALRPLEVPERVHAMSLIEPASDRNISKLDSAVEPNARDRGRHHDA
jgi:hypothetical protein